jgi:hypothetical protein
LRESGTWSRRRPPRRSPLPSWNSRSTSTTARQSPGHRGCTDIDLDLDRGILHIGFNYVLCGGQGIRKDTKTHQERFNAIDPEACAFIREYVDAAKTALGPVGHELPADAYLFSNGPIHAAACNPDWAS